MNKNVGHDVVCVGQNCKSYPIHFIFFGKQNIKAYKRKHYKNVQQGGKTVWNLPCPRSEQCSLALGNVLSIALMTTLL